jgi:nesprin-1
LESGIVKWAEYENKYKDAIEWLTQTDKLVQTYNHLQSNLDNKKRVLEEFQINLQDIFDWQKVLDNLNPVTLLDICADTRISNGITQLTTKYNALLSHSKEVMKRLELYYQEHQQHNTLYEELINWIEKLTEKLNTCKDSTSERQPSQIQTKLNLIKSIKQSLEHGQNKLRYLLELKEKVIINTESAGAAKIDEDTENLKQEYEKLQKDLATIKQELLDRLTQFEEIIKLNKILKDWTNEVEVIFPNEIKLYNDLTEKRSNLEKLRAIQQEMPGYNEIVEKIKTKLDVLPVSDNDEEHELGREIKNYVNLQINIANYIENLENQVNDHEKFKCAYNEIIDWIKQTHLKTEQSSDSHGDRAALMGRLSKLHEIELSFSEGKILLENANDLSVNVINTTKNEGQDLVKEEVRYLKSEWDNLYTNIQSVNDILNMSLRLWNSFMEKCDNMNQKLNSLENKIKETENHSTNQKENLACCKVI